MTDNGLGSSLMGGWDSEGSDERIEALTKSIRRLRAWVMVLSALIVLILCAPAFLVISEFLPTESNLPTAADARAEIVTSLGSSIEPLQVREVQTTPGDTPFPFSLVDRDKGLYVEGTLRPSGVVLADVVWSAQELAPAIGPLDDRMGLERYLKLVAAYRSRADKPMGKAFLYAELNGEGDPVVTELEFNGRKFPATRVWAVSTGFRVGQEPVALLSSEFLLRDVFVFFEDDKTGDFTYLGSERREDTSAMPLD